ncbi:hypothetical protein IPdc08_01800 [archaeon]|nr:hypothetical protein IPdc08_01800 [archaeon]
MDVPTTVPIAMPIFKIIVGIVLIFVASRIVGFVVKTVGLIFIIFAGYEYYIIKIHTLPDIALPVIIGLALVFVGKSIAETAMRIAGLILVIWGIIGLGII